MLEQLELLLKQTRTVKTILDYIDASSKMLQSLTQLTSSIVKQLEAQGDRINNLAILCDMIVRRDPALQEALRKIKEDGSKKVAGSN